MRAAGIRKIGDTAGLIDLPEPRALRAGEVLLDVRACGVGNWDEFVRTGGWDTGARPPMAMGVEAAGLVAAAGNPADGFSVGDPVTTRDHHDRRRPVSPGAGGRGPGPGPAGRPGHGRRAPAGLPGRMIIRG